MAWENKKTQNNETTQQINKIENKAIETKQTNDLGIPQSEVLKKYEQYEVFEKTVKLDYLPN